LIDKFTGFFSKTKVFSIIGLSQLLATLINAVFWLFLASYLPKEEYGELGFYFSIAIFGSSLATIGLDKLIIVYGAKDESIVKPAFKVGLIFATFVSVGIFIFSQNLSASILCWMMLAFSLHFSKLNSKKKFIILSQHVIIRRILAIVFALVFYQFLGINGLIFGFALANIYALRDVYFTFKNFKTDIHQLRSKIPFMLHNYSGTIIPDAASYLDKIAIGIILGFSTLATFQFSIQYFILLNFIGSSITIYMLPNEATGLQNPKLRLNLILLTIPVALLAFFISPIIVDSLFTNFHDSIPLMQITSFVIIPSVVSIILESYFLGNEKSKIVLFSSITQASSYFVLLLLFGSIYGVFGFALAFLIGFSLRALLDIVFYIKLKNK